jgi:hypothetical protein
MIFTFILNIFYAIFRLVFGLLLYLPDASLPSFLTSSLISLRQYFYVFNFFLPIDVLLGALVLMGVFEGAIFIYKFANKIISHIPFVGGR